MKVEEPQLIGSRLLNVLLRRGLVISEEVRIDVAAEPVGQLDDFLAETLDGLVIHVCLGDQARHGHCL